VRGGVYRVVHEAMGGTLAKISVSALMFDYVLTGPISAVSAGLYLAGLINETLEQFHRPRMGVPAQYFAAAFAVVVTLYFWRKNIIGIHESSQKALRIMQITTVMVILLIVWSLITIAHNGYTPVPLPTPANLQFGDDALGWLKGTAFPSLMWVAVMIGLGHSLLAMSGEESLAQVNREIASPKLKNLERAGFVIFLYSMLFTSLVSFFAVMLIPDHERTTVFNENLIGGLAMHMMGPMGLRLLFHGFVVVVGTVILAGAVNTAIVGSNGVMNRVAEDGVLPEALRHPHPKFGTTHRIINLIVLLQIVTILISRGDVNLLGEAYAFGVVWSFAMKAMSVLVLRFKQPGAREWKVPLNLRWGKTELPIGLGLITLTLFALAVVNVLTKKTATISGVTFTLVFFTLFEVSERLHRKRAGGKREELEQFRLEMPQDVSAEIVNIRPGNVLVAASNPNNLTSLRTVIEKTDTKKIDIVVVKVKSVTEAGSGEHDLRGDQVFTPDIGELFSRVVSVAEKVGKHVELMVVPGLDPNDALVQTACRLQSSLIVMGASAKMTPAQQARLFGAAWERLPAPRPQISLQLVRGGEEKPLFFNLGPHPPRLWPEDVDLVHTLWLELGEKGFGSELHHRDVVRVALRRLEAELHSEQGSTVVEHLRKEL
jgi:amino acid transporter/nucleotide-binding universal stress UspA family protein